METSVLHIKNMVCDRCISTVKRELEKLHCDIVEIKLGQATVRGHPSEEDLSEIEHVLHENGFDLVIDRDQQITKDIKAAIVRLIHHSEEPLDEMVLSQYLANTLNHDYKYLSSLFSSHEGLTIEKFYILQRIERVKELLSYGDLTLSEIAWKTGFSSVHHLSAQFKKLTGVTPSAYKKKGDFNRQKLDNIKEG
ncbi:MAG: AraC family transcriptional regulator [Bacteroidales bacterium]|nr:AraC family transcriptional regulator [Bacteroidales bacterium]